MSDLSFGLTLMVMGMGVTFLTLYLLTLVINLLNRLLPPQTVEKKTPAAEGGPAPK